MKPGQVAIIRGDARRIPLPDGCVDLIVTSPPYFGLRSYTGGCPTCAERARAGNRGYMERYCPSCQRVFASGRNKCHICDVTTLRTDATKAAPKTDCPDCGGSGQRHYDGQIGSEATPAEWLAAMVDCTRDWMRVLKPEGSIFINLGDKYAGGGMGAHKGGSIVASSQAYHENQYRRVKVDAPAKSLLGLPWRYALAATDQLGLILRRDIIWSKPNGLPESVTDRCRSSHEYVFHLVRQPRYYAAVDEIREPQAGSLTARSLPAFRTRDSNDGASHRAMRRDPEQFNPLGKLPGSVWDIPSQPLTVPPHLGIDHFAAFPVELPRRIVLGWSPPGVCVACGQGRRPVSVDVGTNRGIRGYIPSDDRHMGQTQRSGPGSGALTQLKRITGYTCACGPPPTADLVNPHVGRGPLPPTRPALVLDPFAGTGTTLLAAAAYGRNAIGIDRSADYCRLARWRVNDPGERAKAMQVPKPPPVTDGQDALFAI